MAEIVPSLHMRTVIAPTGPAGALVLTDEQVAMFGRGANPPVTVAVGDRSVGARVARMGGQNLVGLSKASRAKLGVEIGDEVDVVVTLDTTERAVDVPAELANALAQDEMAQAAFDTLARTYRAEFARWVGDAKKAETRDRRIGQTLQMLREGRHR